MPTDNIDNTKRWLAPKFENFPEYLTKYKHWALWRYEWDEASNDWDKVPYQAHNPTVRASSTNPRTWATIETVKLAYQFGKFDGVLFAMRPETGLTVIDIDECLLNSVPSDHAKEVLNKIPSTYWEISPSVEGLRGFAIGTKKATRCKNTDNDTEVYCDGRFVSVTGHRINKCEITNCQTQLDALCDWLLPEPAKTNSAPCQPVDIDDEALLNKARHSKEGDTFAALFDRDADKLKALGYPSGKTTDLDNSSLDQALANRLAFWCGNEAERIERLMRASALYRDKWDKHRTYLQDTISNAIAVTDKVYTPDPTRLTTSDTERIAAMATEYPIATQHTPDGLLDGPTEEIDIAAHLPAENLAKVDLRPEIAVALKTNTPTVTGACEAPIREWLDITADDFLDTTAEQWLIEDFIALGDIMTLAAPPKFGKLLMLIYAMQGIIYNEPFLGGHTSPACPILYLDFENKRNYFRNWWYTFMQDRDPALTAKYLHYKCRSGIDGKHGKCPEYLHAKWLEEHTKPIEDKFSQPGLIVVDTLRGGFALTPDMEDNWENSASGIGRLLRPIQDVCHKNNWSCIIIHHTNKAGGISGSTDLAGAVDHTCQLWRDMPNNGRVCEITVNGRYCNPPPKRIATFEENHFRYWGSESDWERDGKDQAAGVSLWKIVEGILCKMTPDREYDSDTINRMIDKSEATYKEAREVKKALRQVVAGEQGKGKPQTWVRDAMSDMRLDQLQQCNLA